jgi:anti-sigma factor RsiW
MNRSTQHAFDREELMAYLDGELDPQRAAALAEHLAHCRECEALATQFRQVSERLLDFQVEPTPPNLNAAVFGALESSAPLKKPAPHEIDERIWGTLRRGFGKPVAWALSAATVIALVVFALYQSMTPPRTKIATSWFKVETDLSAPPASRSATAHSVAAGPQFPNDKSRMAEPGGGGRDDRGAIEAPAPAGPMIAQTAALTIVAANYDRASAAVDRLAASQGGYVQKLATEDRLAAAREFSATVRVPAAQLAGFLAELRKLGHVEQETRTNEEVTDQYVDLQARLKSARASEQRMLELLATRTGKLDDVLDAERELARIREEIESMEGQRILLAHRVNYATVEIQLREEYREKLDSRSTSTATKIWNAAVEGYGNLEDGVIGVLLFLLSYGPAILFWLAVLLVPGWFVWRKFRPRA